MASKLYATESLIYRTVGYFEERMSQLSAEEQKDGKAIAASIAEYAIECSINKVCRFRSTWIILQMKRFKFMVDMASCKNMK